MEYIMTTLDNLMHQTAFFNLTVGNYVMIAVAVSYTHLEEVTLSDKMSYVEEYAMLNGYFSFRQLLARQRSKMHVIVTFLAVLELMKVGKIQITQEKTFAEIMITSMM